MIANTALLLLAGFALADASFVLIESFSAAGCDAADLKYQNYRYTEDCRQVEDGDLTYYQKLACSGSNLTYTYYTDSACSTVNTSMPETNKSLACHADAWRWDKITCEANASAGKYETWSGGGDCSGPPNSTGYFEYDLCVLEHDDNGTAYTTPKSIKIEVVGGNLTKRVYNESGNCTGTYEENTWASMTPCSISEEGNGVIITLGLGEPGDAATSTDSVTPETTEGPAASSTESSGSGNSPGSGRNGLSSAPATTAAPAIAGLAALALSFAA